MDRIWTSGENCLAALKKEERELLFSSVTTLNFAAGEMIVRKGTPVHDLFFIDAGCVELIMDDERTSQTLTLLFPGEFIGINCAYSTMHYRFAARALSAATIIVLNRNVFSELLKSNAEFVMSFIQYISMVNENFLNWQMKLKEKNSAGALAFLLCEFQKSTSQKSFEIPLTRKDIARVIGFSKESVLKNLADFRKQNIIASNGSEITILDMQRLNDIASYG